MQQQQMTEPQFQVEGGHLVMYHKDQTGLPQVKDANVNDRDRMQDLLAQEKYLTSAYNVAMFEAGHDALYQDIKQNSDTCHQLQRQIFTLMFKKGWYKLPVADADSVSHTFTQWQQYQAQLPFPPGQQRSVTKSPRINRTNENPVERQLNEAVEQAMEAAVKGDLPTNVMADSH